MCMKYSCSKAGIHAKVGDIVETTPEYISMGVGKYERCVLDSLDGKLATLRSGHCLSVHWLQKVDSWKEKIFRRHNHDCCCCCCR